MTRPPTRRPVDVLAAATVFFLGLPLVVLGLLNVGQVWTTDGRVVAWQVVLMAVVLIGMWRASRVMRR